MPVTELERLAALPQVDFVEAARLLSPMLDTSLPETHANRVHHPPSGGRVSRGTGVVVGIVDFGLDFTLDDFIDVGGKTRVAFLWDQLLEPKGAERSPAGFDYGMEYDTAAINQALQALKPFDVVRHEPDPESHGTHVAGIAAGNGRSADATFAAGRFIGPAPGATIVFVQPHPGDAEGSFTDSVHVAEAIIYIFDKATELVMPCVINMSLGAERRQPRRGEHCRARHRPAVGGARSRVRWRGRQRAHLARSCLRSASGRREAGAAVEGRRGAPDSRRRHGAARSG